MDHIANSRSAATNHSHRQPNGLLRNVTRATLPKQRTSRTLLLIVLALTVLGLLAVGSSASEFSERYYSGDPAHLFLEQAQRALLGLVLMLLLSQVPYKLWKLLVIPGLVVAMGCLVLVRLNTPFAVEANGAVRWLRFGSFQFQPSEVARYALVLFIAWWGWKQGRRMHGFVRGYLPMLAVALLMVWLIVMQPDFSTAAMLLATSLVVMYIAGARIRHIALLLVPAVVAGAYLVVHSPYKLDRIRAVLNPMADPDKSGYQLIQSFIGLGRGGLFGVGPGASRQKMFFLPEAHTDFIYSIIGEEFGFLGTMLLLVLFIVLIYIGLKIARRCPEPFGAYLAAGITLSIGCYALANMAVTVGLLPPTGLPLPLISYGGTSLLMTLAELGILLNIARGIEEKPRTKPVPARTAAPKMRKAG